MTEVSKVASLAMQLKEQYQDRVSELRRKIEEQQQEINQLQEQIKLLSEPKDYDEFKEVIENDGWCYVWWHPDADNEARIKEETKATLRCIPLEQPGGKGQCIFSGEETSIKAYFAKAY